jgi:putative NADH-flavin reductase
MAQVIEEVIIIKVSKLAKNGVGVTSCVTQETLFALEQVAQELLGTDVVVEAEKA